MSENQVKSQVKPNPLANWYRQPKIYIKLPSKGNFYPEGSLDKSVSGDYPVFAMTAKDELMMKTPDALLNGNSTVEVIKSCIPSILNPWEMPSLDVDAVLIAIRIATYGEEMDVSANCPHCTAENNYSIPLIQWLDSLNTIDYKDNLPVDQLTIHIRPFNYLEMTRNSLKALEHQKIFAVINDEEMSDEEKLEKFGKSFIKLTELTVDLIASCIKRIDTPDGFSEDQSQIKEFLHNAPKEVFEKVSNHVTDLKSKMEMPVQTVKCGDCSQEYLMPVIMDHSNFFAVRS